MKLKKGWLGYGIVMIIFFLCFVFSPRFGWYGKDSYSGCWLRYAGTRQESLEKITRYRGSKAKLRLIETKGETGYQIEYEDKRQEGETPEHWETESSAKLREVPMERIPVAIGTIRDTLYVQDKQARGVTLFVAVLLLGAASFLMGWCGIQGIRQNRLLKRDIGILLGLMLFVLYAGSCLRMFHWSGLDVLFLVRLL